MEQNMSYSTGDSVPRAQVTDAHFVLEDRFNNSRWRFELDEVAELNALINDMENGPSSYSVHLVSSTVDVTNAFTRPSGNKYKAPRD